MVISVMPLTMNVKNVQTNVKLVTMLDVLHVPIQELVLQIVNVLMENGIMEILVSLVDIDVKLVVLMV